MKFDLHTHHSRCGHAVGDIRDYIESAIEKGFQVIGISDHTPYFADEEDQAQPGIAMPKSEFANYINEVLRLKEEYANKIDVLLGVESDFFAEHVAIYKQQLAQYPFDYIIGSVHYVNGVSIFNKRRFEKLSKGDKVREKEAYFDLIQQSAKSKMFDILGHIDAMKAYYPPFSDIKTDVVDETLRIIAEHDVAVEINTSGKTKLVGGWYPADDILERACHYGVQVTFGSDAHTPERVGDDWDDVQARLREIGFKEWVYYKERQKQIVSI